MSVETVGVTARLTVTGLNVTNTAGIGILHDVSTSIRAGEILGVVGETGSGKSTLAMAMLGHARAGLRVAGGTVELEGRSLFTLSARELRRLRGETMSYVPQDPGTSLNPNRRIGAQLREVLIAHGRDRDATDARVRDLLEEVQLTGREGLLRAYPHQLSGGQQQRVLLAMAFALRPKLVVLDEPTTGLDVATQRRVLETMGVLCETYQVSAVLISHDIKMVEAITSRVAVLYGGRIIESGTTATVLEQPAHPYTIGLRAAAPTLDASTKPTGIPGSPPTPGEHPPGCCFAPRCEYATLECEQGVPALTVTDEPDHLARCIRLPVVAARASTTVRTLDRPTPAIDAPPGLDPVSPILTVQGLAAAYGGQRVLTDINLTLEANTCLAVVGESGSGKTTMARCLAGMHREWSGDCTFHGERLAPWVRNRSPLAMRSIQYVFQNPYASLNPLRTIGNSIRRPLNHFFDLPGSELDDRVLAIMDSVSLPSRMLNRYPDQLSGGERQRAALARALVVEPRLLICDEVTSALDVSVQATIIDLLSDLQSSQSLAILFVTHNLALVKNFAQEIVVLHHGTIVDQGDVEQVLNHSTHEYTRQLYVDLSFIERARRSLPPPDAQATLTLNGAGSTTEPKRPG